MVTCKSPLAQRIIEPRIYELVNIIGTTNGIYHCYNPL